MITSRETSHYGFNLLVAKYQQKVYWMVRRMMISHDDTNDVVQNVFLRIWLNIPSFRRESALYTWIYRITVNETISALRKKRLLLFLPIHDLEADLARTLQADPYITGTSVQIKLQRALLKLPTKQRLVFNLKFFEEMTYEEMSEILGTSVGALKASYHFANKRIEQYLNSI